MEPSQPYSFDKYGNPQHKTGYEDYYEQYIPLWSDESAQFALMCIAGLIVTILLFVLREKCKNEADGRLHPFHQRYEEYQGDLKERDEKKRIAEKIEYMSSIDHEAYLG